MNYFNKGRCDIRIMRRNYLFDEVDKYLDISNYERIDI